MKVENNVIYMEPGDVTGVYVHTVAWENKYGTDTYVFANQVSAERYVRKRMTLRLEEERAMGHRPSAVARMTALMAEDLIAAMDEWYEFTDYIESFNTACEAVFDITDGLDRLTEAVGADDDDKEQQDT